MKPEKSADAQVSASGEEAETRFAELIDRFRTRKEAAERLEISTDQLARYLKGEAPPSLAVMLRLADISGVSLDWLAGRRSKRADSPGAAKRRLDQALAAIDANPTEFALLPRFEITASAGPGLFADDENIVDYLAFRDDWIRDTLRSRPSDLVLLDAAGDSMAPRIEAGDTLLIDRGVDTILDDAVYVLGLGEALVVKRVQRLLNGVVLKSDNPNYDPITVAKDEVEELRVLGRVRWIGKVV